MNENVLFCRSPLGVIRLAAKDGALVSAVFTDETGTDSPCPVLTEAAAWLGRYFEGRDPGPIPQCLPQGTAFQKAVWNALLSVPYGETISYAALEAVFRSTPTELTQLSTVWSSECFSKV